MGSIRIADPVILFCAVTGGNPGAFSAAVAALVERFGPATQRFGPIDFSAFTSYYTAEMGEGLLKTYLLFDRPAQRDDLSQIKHFSNALEDAGALEGKRVVNIDPGYVSTDKLVLASTKDFYHRIGIGGGIFAEVTLHVRHGKWRFFSWTYGDYKADGVIALLNTARTMLAALAKSQLVIEH